MVEHIGHGWLMEHIVEQGDISLPRNTSQCFACEMMLMVRCGTPLRMCLWKSLSVATEARNDHHVGGGFHRCVFAVTAHIVHTIYSSVLTFGPESQRPLSSWNIQLCNTLTWPYTYLCIKTLSMPDELGEHIV